MQIACVITSEHGLSLALDWLSARRVLDDLELHLLVIADQKGALTQSVQLRIQKYADDGLDAIYLHQFSPSEEKIDAKIHERVKQESCAAVLVFYRSSESSLQQEFFSGARVPVLWVKGCGLREGNALPLVEMRTGLSPKIRGIVSQLFGATGKPTIAELSSGSTEGISESLESAMEDKLSTGANPIFLIEFEQVKIRDPLYAAALAMLRKEEISDLVLVRRGDSLIESLSSRVLARASRIAPAMEREERIDLANDLTLGSRPNMEFVGLIAASSMMASFGLLQNSPSVIIGAMLIAPLMTPILGAGLALTQGNRPLFKSSLVAIFWGFVSAFAASFVFGGLFLIFREPVNTNEMWARCQPSPLDFCVGLVGGLAASYARTRRHLSSALAGAAIAAALVPPIATAGLQLAFQEWEDSERGVPITGPLLLVSVNVLTIMIGSSFVLWLRGMRPDSSGASDDRWVLRSIAFLLLMALMIFIWILRPIFLTS